ncbi:MAG TPA: hypothetical protein VKE95_06160, partial [Burkholderiales bacterium]|nr:hypothetical protein [Burkholderiales bacterium]
EPSLLNIFKGYYGLWSEQSLNKSFDFGTATWSADQRAVVNKLFTSLGDTSVIRAANGGFRQVWGAGANMTTFFNGTPFDPGATLTMANLQTNPVSAVSKTLDPTLGPDNCNPPFAFGPAQR